MGVDGCKGAAEGFSRLKYVRRWERQANLLMASRFQTSSRQAPQTNNTSVGVALLEQPGARSNDAVEPRGVEGTPRCAGACVLALSCSRKQRLARPCAPITSSGGVAIQQCTMGGCRYGGSSVPAMPSYKARVCRIKAGTQWDVRGLDRWREADSETYA
jgi:hypothetical protein